MAVSKCAPSNSAIFFSFLQMAGFSQKHLRLIKHLCFPCDRGYSGTNRKRTDLHDAYGVRGIRRDIGYCLRRSPGISDKYEA